MERDGLDWLIDHVFLPPKLPQTSEPPDKEQASRVMLWERLINAVDNFAQGADPTERASLGRVQKLLKESKKIQDGSCIEANVLNHKIKSMLAGDVLCLWLEKQNAGIVIRHMGDEMTVESFEAAPLRQEVLTTSGRLVCSFPGPSVAVPASELQSEEFLDQLSDFLAKVSTQDLDISKARFRKAGEDTVDERESADPVIVTQMLTGILRALGRSVDAACTINKCIRDDVLYSEGGHLWRRCPLWLVLRVAIQTTLESVDQTTGRRLYKLLMAYFATEILSLALKQELTSSDSLSFMSKKIAVKISKILSPPAFVIDQSDGVIRAVSEHVRRRQREDEERWHPDLPEVALDHHRWSLDTKLSLERSSAYLEEVLNDAHSSPDCGDFVPKEAPRRQDSDVLPKLPSLDWANHEEICIVLSDMESWIEEHLAAWCERNSSRADCATLELQEAISSYSSLAKSIYSECPDDFSIMILTLMELWSALDTIATDQCPLLAEYPPAIPLELLHPLLLPKSGQMIRLMKFEEYLRCRWKRARHGYPSIFDSNYHRNMFHVRYFDDCTMLQDLERKIIGQANKDLREKEGEYTQKRDTRNSLLARADELDHTFRTWTNRWGNSCSAHCNYCEKCRLEREADIDIDIYEWPLPGGPNAPESGSKVSHKRKVVVFELQPPEIFQAWRAATYEILAGVCTEKEPDIGRKETYKEISDYVFLKGEPTYPSVIGGLTLKSTAKSHLDCHHRRVAITLPLSDVCRSHGCTWSLFDSNNCAAQERIMEPDIRPMCTPTLPYPYKILQYTLEDTKHTSNDVIASQNDCPKEISLHEYLSFGELRAGRHLQWFNIGKELGSKNLTLSNESVAQLILQAVWQVEYRNKGDVDFRRPAHLDCGRSEFVRTLLGRCERLWDEIEQNWTERICALILISATLRMLSLGACQITTEIRDFAISLLRRGRAVIARWIWGLREPSDNSDCYDTRALEAVTVQLAAISRLTYDVDASDIDDVLSTDQDVQFAVETSLIINDKNPTNRDYDSPISRRLLNKHRRVSHMLEDHLRGRISRCSFGLDKAVRSCWGTYAPNVESSWEVLSKPNSRWLTRETSDGPVHLNLLTGELLLCGLPLTHLPQEILRDDCYRRLFKNESLEVFRSRGGFKSRYTFHNYSLRFTYHANKTDTKLTIRAKNETGKYKILDHQRLRGDFPDHLVDCYVHWMDVRSGVVEFRPISAFWEPRDENWRLQYCSQGGPYMTNTRGRRLLDISSETRISICRLLAPMLEMRSLVEVYLTDFPHQITDAETKSRSLNLAAHLPRLKLDFTINTRGRLECKQLRGFVVDQDQRLGTLSGFKSRLVMKEDPQLHYIKHPKRKIIIPHGPIELCRSGTSSTESFVQGGGPGYAQRKIPYHVYTVDSVLQIIRDPGSLLSRLYKIYLHAITSATTPDPFTGMTGTEQALSDLRASVTRSFQTLDPKEIDLLRRIAELTPTRNYYPQHLRVMQTIRWNASLSALSQSEGFYESVNQIFAHYSKFQMFFPWTLPELDVDTVVELSQRSACHYAPYANEESGASHISKRVDRVYRSRHLLSAGEKGPDRELLVYMMALKTQQQSSSPDLNPVLSSWYRGCENITGFDTSERLPLGYDIRWINLERSELRATLLPLAAICGRLDLKVPSQRFRLLFTLCTLAFASKIDIDLVWTILAFASNSLIQSLLRSAPRHAQYSISQGASPDEEKLRKILTGYIGDVDTLYSDYDGRAPKERLLLKREYDENVGVDTRSAVSTWMRKWPCNTVSRHDVPHRLRSCIAEEEAMIEDICAQFKTWYQNRELQIFTESLEGQLLQCKRSAQSASFSRYRFDPPPWNSTQASLTVAWEQVISETAPSLPVPPSLRYPLGSTSPLLERVLRSLHNGARTTFELQYTEELEHSLREHHATCLPSSETAELSHLQEFYEACYDTLQQAQLILDTVHNCSLEEPFSLLHASGLWPRFTPISLLHKLSSPLKERLPLEWRKVLLSYAGLVAIFQASERLLRLSLNADNDPFDAQDLSTEISSLHAPDIGKLRERYPELQLFEIENDLRIRPTQMSMASSMIFPSDGKNTVFQLNMGEGKSSVLVPIIASALGDGDTLVRIVVLKPLAAQMFRLLVNRLGGLLNKPIYYMPFSRSVPLTESNVKMIWDLFRQCKQERGVLLAQPEHLLSLKLAGLEKLCNNNSAAPQILDIQSWLEENTRDVIDESDEVLHVKYQLIYTLGLSRPVEHSPARWSIIQQVLSRVKMHAENLSRKYLEEIEVTKPYGNQCGAFPMTRIFQDRVASLLMTNLIKDLEEERIQELRLVFIKKSLRGHIIRYITDGAASLSDQQLRAIEEGVDPSKYRTILLLSGILNEKTGLLRTALRDKRWRVDYGLDPTRTLYSVPYRGKDSPALRAEFSHPDVAILLTCLSYYYGGLTNTQIRVCFDILRKGNNPAAVYEGWVKCECDKVCTLHAPTLQSVNLEDPIEFHKVCPDLRNRKAVIDFFLSQVVFPKEARDFEHKLTASGWDIAEEKQHPTTGFSGTNDNRYLLPLSIRQGDIKENQGTSAKVLLNLLGAGNNHYYRLPINDKVKTLLKRVVGADPKIRVILDVGAQILWENEKVAKKLLRLTEESENRPQAIVYFSREDELIVRERDGTSGCLHTSPFATQLDQCFVYLDEVHTRGTDLKFPPDYRAAVTLGPKLVKDRLVQACMRMRRLGKGHSVTFFAPPEVDQNIRCICRLGDDEKIETQHIVRWSLMATIQSTKDNARLWASQGLSYRRRHTIDPRKEMAAAATYIKEDEAQSLVSLYGKDRRSSSSMPHEDKDRDILSRLHCLGVSSLEGALQDEEQEREIEQETFRERQVERPSKATPASPSLHPILQRLVDGYVPVNLADEPGLTSPFDILRNSSAKDFFITGWSDTVLASPDFLKTIEDVGDMDEYLRPVTWVLVVGTGSGPALLLISPYEANQILPELRESRQGNAYLCLYSPRTTADMQSFDNLRAYTVPPFRPDAAHPTDHQLQELCLFAGGLYFPRRQVYLELAKLLGLCTETELGDMVISTDRFVKPENREAASINASSCSFTESPIPLLVSLTSFRRKGQNVSDTHIGKIFDGRVLRESDFGKGT